MHWEDPEGWDGAGGGRGGSGWETHINPWLIHVNVWQKSLQYCKVISLQLIKINEKKKENVPLNIAVILNFCWKQSIVSLNESLHRSHIDVLYTLNGVSLWLSGLKMGKKKKKKESSCQAGDMAWPVEFQPPVPPWPRVFVQLTAYTTVLGNLSDSVL